MRCSSALGSDFDFSLIATPLHDLWRSCYYGVAGLDNPRGDNLRSLASHRPRITGSFRWSALHSSEIDRLITSQARTASRISVSIASTSTFGLKRSRANRCEQDGLHWRVDRSRTELFSQSCGHSFGDLLETIRSVRLDMATQHPALTSRYCRSNTFDNLITILVEKHFSR